MDILAPIIILLAAIYAIKTFISDSLSQKETSKTKFQKIRYNPVSLKNSPIKKLTPLLNKNGTARKTRNKEISPDFQYILFDKPLTIEITYKNNTYKIDTGYITGSKDGDPQYLTGRILDEEGCPTLSYLTFTIQKITNIQNKNKNYTNASDFINNEI